MAKTLTLKERFDRKLPRVVKTSRQLLRAAAVGGSPATRLVFVVGSQRSGTRLPMQIMDYSDEIGTYSEGTAPFFDGVLLRPLERIEQLIRRSPFPIVALKPICETHRITELLDRFPESRSFWIFRHFEDAVNSASVKWRSGREAVRRLAAGELNQAAWRAGGLTAERLELVRRLYRDDMSLHEANAVMWYLRNNLFFDLRADARPDIRLVRYEDLVSQPHQRFADLFDFIGTPMPARCVDAVQDQARPRRPFPPIAPEIRSLCEQLYQRLLVHYTASDDALRHDGGRQKLAPSGVAPSAGNRRSPS